MRINKNHLNILFRPANVGIKMLFIYALGFYNKELLGEYASISSLIAISVTLVGLEYYMVVQRDKALSSYFTYVVQFALVVSICLLSVFVLLDFDITVLLLLSEYLALEVIRYLNRHRLHSFSTLLQISKSSLWMLWIILTIDLVALNDILIIWTVSNLMCILVFVLVERHKLGFSFLQPKLFFTTIYKAKSILLSTVSNKLLNLVDRLSLPHLIPVSSFGEYFLFISFPFSIWIVIELVLQSYVYPGLLENKKTNVHLRYIFALISIVLLITIIFSQIMDYFFDISSDWIGICVLFLLAIAVVLNGVLSFFLYQKHIENLNSIINFGFTGLYIIILLLMANPSLFELLGLYLFIMISCCLIKIEIVKRT
jgi:hypothetical protein